jgi:hypothetical protein
MAIFRWLHNVHVTQEGGFSVLKFQSDHELLTHLVAIFRLYLVGRNWEYYNYSWLSIHIFYLYEYGLVDCIQSFFCHRFILPENLQFKNGVFVYIFDHFGVNYRMRANFLL